MVNSLYIQRLTFSEQNFFIREIKLANTPIEFTNVTPETLVAPQSRYLKQNVIYYGEQRFLTFDTYIRTPYEPTGKERVMLITKGNEYRPDLVSFDVYGFPDSWWLILEANGMKDIFEFVAGRTIILPNRTS